MATLILPQIGDRPQAGDFSLLARMLVVTHFVQKQTMDRLSQSRRYGKLSLAYTDYVFLLVERDHSPGELAERLGISKQACSKTLRELEALGLLSRRVNPKDSRSSMLSLSAKGIDLLRDGVDAANSVQQQLADAISAPRLQRLLGVLDRLYRAVDVESAADRSIENTVASKAGSRPTRLAAVLSKLSRVFRARLQASMVAKGYSDLRPGVGQMLGMIDRESRRLQHMAAILGVSKQAVAAMAAELEQQGYATRADDPEDRRQIIVSLSPRGQELLRDAAASVAEVEAAIEAAVGEADYRLLDEAMAIFHAEITERHDSVGALRNRIQQLSQQLVSELGMTGAHALAQQLMTLTRGKR
jgi:DNA-binding MarR family transcriptional regulator